MHEPVGTAGDAHHADADADERIGVRKRSQQRLGELGDVLDRLVRRELALVDAGAVGAAEVGDADAVAGLGLTAGTYDPGSSTTDTWNLFYLADSQATGTPADGDTVQLDSSALSRTFTVRLIKQGGFESEAA